MVTSHCGTFAKKYSPPLRRQSCNRGRLEQQILKLQLPSARFHSARKEIHPSWQCGSGDWSDGTGIQCALFQVASYFFKPLKLLVYDVPTQEQCADKRLLHIAIYPQSHKGKGTSRQERKRTVSLVRPAIPHSGEAD